MIASFVAVIATALAFAGFGYAGVLLADTYFAGDRIADGPPVGEPPVLLLVAACAIAGGVCATRHLGPSPLVLVAICATLMTTIWCVDVRRGIIPDALTLWPLAVLVVAGLLTRHWYIAVVAAIPAAPFAFMAWRTKGLGMGWGDVKLAALGGALLGFRNAMLSFAIASIVAIVIAKLQRSGSRPVAFAPYLASAILLPLCLQTGT